jgi:hypothetical protein
VEAKGFKPLGIVPNKELAIKGYAVIKLQFHWMPRKIHATTPLLMNGKELTAAYDYSVGQPESGIAMARPGNGRLVKSGDIYYHLIPREHMKKELMAWKIQWSLIKISVIAGGAGPLELVRYRSDFIDETGVIPIARDIYVENHGGNFPQQVDKLETITDVQKEQMGNVGLRVTLAEAEIARLRRVIVTLSLPKY